MNPMKTNPSNEKEVRKLRDYERLVQDKYLDFFEQKDAVYTAYDGIHPPRYVGVAFEFICEISSSDLDVDYSDLYDNVFKDEKWLFVDSLVALSDGFIDSLSARQIVTIFAAMRHKELFCSGFLEQCGKMGVVIKLLKKLKRKIEKGSKV